MDELRIMLRIHKIAQMRATSMLALDDAKPKKEGSPPKNRKLPFEAIPSFCRVPPLSHVTVNCA
jgi:hypothetical protein